MNDVKLEALKEFDCLMICIQLALSWDEIPVKRLLDKHGLLKDHAVFDPAFALYRLHHEFHNAESPVAKELTARFARRYRGDIERIRALPEEEQLDATGDLLKQSPAGCFWAMATDERMGIHALSCYHAHRLLLEAFRPSSGSVFAFADCKEHLAGQKEEIRALREKCASLECRLEAEKWENSLLKKKLEADSGRQRELRMRSYERKHSGGVRPVAVPDELSVTVEKDGPPDFDASCDCRKKRAAGQCALENLKIALVGGLDRLENQYRAAFESLGAAKFYFHSGCCDGGGAERLRSTTAAADIVIFVTRINSHNALNVLKGVCRKSGKSFLAVRATSPEQISKIVLRELPRALPGAGKESIPC